MVRALAAVLDFPREASLIPTRQILAAESAQEVFQRVPVFAEISVSKEGFPAE